MRAAPRPAAAPSAHWRTTTVHAAGLVPEAAGVEQPDARAVRVCPPLRAWCWRVCGVWPAPPIRPGWRARPPASRLATLTRAGCAFRFHHRPMRLTRSGHLVARAHSKRSPPHNAPPGWAPQPETGIDPKAAKLQAQTAPAAVHRPPLAAVRMAHCGVRRGQAQFQQPCCGADARR
eukprot:scaffold22834_cov119-Isochrysis_galbana.AAC.1